MLSICILFALCALTGCQSGLGPPTPAQVAQLQADNVTAQRAHAAATQATAQAQTAMDALPADAPNRAAARDALARAEQAEREAARVLDLVQTTLAAIAAQNQSAATSGPSSLAGSATGAAVDRLAVAVAALPSPYAPLVAALIPVAIGVYHNLRTQRKISEVHAAVTALADSAITATNAATAASASATNTANAVNAALIGAEQHPPGA